MGWQMLKRRIIPIQLLSRSRLVKTRKFKNPRDVGDPIMSSRVYSNQDADELILLNIDRVEDSLDSLLETTSNILKECFVPFTVGGGIRSLNDAEKLFATGADKVVINTMALKKPTLISEIAESAGSQALVVGIDVRFNNGEYVVYSDCSETAEKIKLSQHIQNIITLGAGEILIQSIDRDGEMQGYDLDLLEKVISESDIPVISAGGAGNFKHLFDAFEIGVDAVACGSLFNFGDNNPLRAKAFLKNLGVPLKKIK